MAEQKVTVIIAGDPSGALKALNAVKGQAEDTRSHLQRVGESMVAAGKRLTIGLTLPLIAAGAAAFKMAGDFDDAMDKIVGLVGVSREQVEAWQKDILSLSKEVAKSPKELADALFVVTSAGFRGSEAFDVLTSSAKASAAGLGETKIVAHAVTSAVNAYGIQNLSASRATDVLVGTVREGNVEASSLAGVLGMVIAPAQAMGVEFHELGAAIASMTRLGLDASMATTSLRGLLVNFIKPSNEARKTLEELGTSVDQVRENIREKGLLAAMQDLRDRTGDNKDAIGKLLPDQRAMNAFLVLTGENASQNAGIFRNLASDTEFAGDAFKAVSDDAFFKFQQSLESIRGALITVGNAVAPIFATIAGWVAKVADLFTKLPEPVKNVVVVIASIAAAIGPVLFIVGKLILAFVTLRGVAFAASLAMGGVNVSLIGVAGALGVAAVGIAAFVKGQSDAKAKGDELTRSLATDFVAAIKAGDLSLEELGEKLNQTGFLFNTLREKGELGTAMLRVNKEELLKLVEAELTVQAETKAVTDQIADFGDKLATETTPAVQTFAEMTGTAFDEWEASTKDSFNGVKGALVELAGKSHLTANEIIAAFGKQIQAMDQYQGNWDELIARGLPQSLAKQLQDMGLQGAGIVAALAKANDAQFLNITRQWESAERRAGRLSGTIRREIFGLPDTKTITVTITEIRRSLIGSPGAHGGFQHKGGLIKAHGGLLAPDDVPAVLQLVEFVIRRSAVEALGVDFFRDLNRGRLPAGGSPGGGSITIAPTINVQGGARPETVAELRAMLDEWADELVRAMRARSPALSRRAG